MLAMSGRSLMMMRTFLGAGAMRAVAISWKCRGGMCLARSWISWTPALARFWASERRESVGCAGAASSMAYRGGNNGASALLGHYRERTIEKVGVEFAGYEVGVGKDFFVEGDGGLDAFYYEAFERAVHSGNGFGAVVAVSNYFGD